METLLPPKSTRSSVPECAAERQVDIPESSVTASSAAKLCAAEPDSSLAIVYESNAHDAPV
jgi:hypothetical protein